MEPWILHTLTSLCTGLFEHAHSTFKINSNLPIRFCKIGMLLRPGWLGMRHCSISQRQDFSRLASVVIFWFLSWFQHHFSDPGYYYISSIGIDTSIKWLLRHLQFFTPFLKEFDISICKISLYWLEKISKSSLTQPLLIINIVTTKNKIMTSLVLRQREK